MKIYRKAMGKVCDILKLTKVCLVSTMELSNVLKIFALSSSHQKGRTRLGQIVILCQYGLLVDVWTNMDYCNQFAFVVGKCRIRFNQSRLAEPKPVWGEIKLDMLYFLYFLISEITRQYLVKTIKIYHT